MAEIPNELISRFSNLQPNIWQSVGVAVSEAAGTAVDFNDPLTLACPITDLYSEMASPKLIVQFAFANAPESMQVILVSSETVQDMVLALAGRQLEAVDESALADIRPAVEALVQGLCVAAGQIKNEAVVATNLSIRLQIFSLPHSMQSAEHVVRTNVRMSAESLNGSAIWLTDLVSVKYLTGVDLAEEAQAAQAANGQAPIPGLADSGLDLLLDIPLEVTVELGRVRMVVKDVIELGSGSIVEIDKAAGEPVDLMVNGRLVARGEVVVIEDNFGVRITEILSPADRLARLNEVA